MSYTHTHTHTQHIKMRAVESVSTAQRNAMLQLALCSWPEQQHKIDDTECTPNSILVIYISKAKGRRVSSDVYIQNGRACICYISHTRRGRNTQVIYDEIYSCGWIGSTKISAVSIVYVSLYVCVCVYKVSPSLIELPYRLLAPYCCCCCCVIWLMATLIQQQLYRPRPRAGQEDQYHVMSWWRMLMYEQQYTAQ